MKYFKFLKKPYPFNNDLKQNAKIIFFLSIGIIAFLLLFQPININSLSFNKKIYIIVGFFVINLFTLSINLLILPNLFPRLFIPHKWKIKKEILWNLWLLVNIYFGDFIVYYKLLNIVEFNFYFFVNLLLIATIPISILIVYNRNRLLRIHLESAKRISAYKKDKTEKVITIQSSYKKDSLTIAIQSIIYIKAFGNYINVYWQNNNELNHQLVRSTLSKVKLLFDENSSIKQCHRSILVNTNYIESIKKSFNENIINLKINNIKLPISKSYEKQFIDLNINS